METTKSVVVHKFGSYDVLKIENHPLPELKNLIEVDVYYCGLNFCDIYKRLGFFGKPFPFVMGSEACGIITKISFDSDEFKIGDKVICYDFEEGMYRNILRITPDKCFKIPAEIPMDVGAAIFLNYITAYFALFELGGLKPGYNILIKSCVGGFGCAATQLAKTIPNVTIYGVLSKGKEHKAYENGVDNVYTNEDDLTLHLINDCPEGFDLILDNQSGCTIAENCKLLKSLGKIILLSANSLIDNSNYISLFTKLKLFFGILSFQLTNLMEKSNSVCGLHTGYLIRENRGKTKQYLNLILDLYKQKKINPIIYSIWPIDNVIEATKILAERKNVGKVLLKMN